MAVKAVRVYVDDERCRHGPIKLGACGGIACDAVSRLRDTVQAMPRIP
jgi:hypothetical protein